MTANVKFAKVRPDAKIPSKRVEDMGFDIYACFDEDYIKIGPNETKLIPTGIASSCDAGYGFVLRERGSTGSKGIALRAGVIDSGYRNEWFVGLTNTTNCTLYISKLSKKEIVDMEYNAGGELAKGFDTLFGSLCSIKDNLEKTTMVYPYSKAIVQALVIPVPEVEVEELSYEDLQAIPSERGLGALGSSGK
ncbi:MAG: dUTP pyrophosphatase [Kiritimatiellae bacterium]|nr:dUTP pyrophosphatase [Kiritimatiellia bacterium]